MNSSSSDSEDENIVLLRQAVDTNFISDGMFTAVTSSTNEIASKKEASMVGPSPATIGSLEVAASTAKLLKSQRFIEHDDIETDLNVPKTMQDFIYKKMSKRIADSAEFVEVPVKKNKKSKPTDDIGCVRLLKGADPISKLDLDARYEATKGEKVMVKKRIIEPDGYDHEEKLRMVAVTGESIQQQVDTRNWPTKKSHMNKVFKYRKNGAILHFIEPDNEFSKLRRQNQWNESKIKNSPWKNHHEHVKLV